MEITKVLCPTNKFNIKCPYSMVPDGVTLHNTANDASAMAEISYMIGNNNQVSFHDAVDDYRVVRGIEHNRNAWHSGDGANGFGNRKTIGIEICYSLSGGERFDKAERLSSKYIAYLMVQYGWGLDRISDKRIGTHQDRSGKYCPHRSLDRGINRIWDWVKEEYYKLTNTNSSNAQIYKVQVGAFKNKEGASNYEKELNGKGFDTYIVNIDGYYKVQVGAYSNEKNARRMAKRLNAAGYNTFIAGLNESSNGIAHTGVAYRIKCNYPNIRSSASLNSSVIRLGNYGEIVYVTGRVNDFLKLEDGTYLKIGYADKI